MVVNEAKQRKRDYYRKGPNKYKMSSVANNPQKHHKRKCVLWNCLVSFLPLEGLWLCDKQGANDQNRRRRKYLMDLPHTI